MNKKHGISGCAVSVFVIICLIITGFLLPQSAGKAAFKAVSLGAYSYAPYKNKETKAATENTQQAKSKVENVAVKKEKKKSTFSFQTDEDVQSLIDKYKAVAEKDEKDAAISEENLHESGKTESYADVFVKNTNKTPADIKEHLERRAELSVDKSKPAVLIYHTHTTESYQILDRDFYAAGFKSRSNSDKLNMVRVGDAICAALENAGFKVIHDRNIYDAAYSGAYYRSYDAAEKIINENPSVHITLDIHRDAIQYDSGTKVKPTASVNGKKAAQIMIISGCQEKGNGIEDFPDWDKNLTFALHLQQQLEKDYSGLTRPVFFCARDYNMNLTPCSLLIEIGTDGNTLEEAVYSGKLLGASLARLMENYIEEE